MVFLHISQSQRPQQFSYHFIHLKKSFNFSVFTPHYNNCSNEARTLGSHICDSTGLSGLQRSPPPTWSHFLNIFCNVAIHLFIPLNVSVMLLPTLKSCTVMKLASGCTCQQTIVTTEDRLHRQTRAQPNCKAYSQLLHVLFSLILTKPMGDVMGGPLCSSAHCRQDGKQKIRWRKQPIPTLCSLKSESIQQQIQKCVSTR